MTTQTYAEDNLLDVLTSGPSRIVLGRIDAVQHGAAADASESAGVLTLSVERELTAPASALVTQPPAGTSRTRVELGFLQLADPMKRQKAGGLGWNGVDIKAGTWLVVAFADPAAWPAPPAIAVARAVSAVRSPHDLLVGGIDQVLKIERETVPQRRAVGVAQSLAAEAPILRDYGHQAAGRLQRIPRQVAAEVEITFLRDPSIDARLRAPAVFTLAQALWRAAGGAPDDVNARILSALIGTLGEPEPVLAQPALSALHALLVQSGGTDAARALRDIELPAREGLLENLRRIGQLPGSAKQADDVRRFLIDR